jgi:hypothetical protein
MPLRSAGWSETAKSVQQEEDRQDRRQSIDLKSLQSSMDVLKSSDAIKDPERPLKENQEINL